MNGKWCFGASVPISWGVFFFGLGIALCVFSVITAA
jgi:hypothetical protein